MAKDKWPLLEGYKAARNHCAPRVEYKGAQQNEWMLGFNMGMRQNIRDRGQPPDGRAYHYSWWNQRPVLSGLAPRS